MSQVFAVGNSPSPLFVQAWPLFCWKGSSGQANYSTVRRHRLKGAISTAKGLLNKATCFADEVARWCIVKKALGDSRIFKQVGVTIVVVCRDNPAQLEVTLQSLELAGLPPCAEVLVVDGSSDDYCRDVLQNWQKGLATTDQKSWSISWIWLTPQGVYQAFNAAIGMARGRWLMFMNSGDSYLAMGLAHLLQVVDHQPTTLDMVVGQALIVSPAAGIQWLSPDLRVRRLDRWKAQMVPCHQAILFARDFALSHPYPESAGPCGDRFVMRAGLSRSERSIYVPQPICIHRLDGVSNVPPSLAELQTLWTSVELSILDRFGLLLKFLLLPLWRWRPHWMKARSYLLGILFGY